MSVESLSYARMCIFANSPLDKTYSFFLSGGALERGFRRVINDVPVGSLLIQSDSKSGEALLLQVMLPFYVRLRHLAETTFVFLLDAQVGKS